MQVPGVKVTEDRIGRSGVPSFMIAVNGQLTGCVDIFDKSNGIIRHAKVIIDKYKPNVIFKSQYDTTAKYASDKRFVPCGLYRSDRYTQLVKSKSKKRDIDITCRMRTHFKTKRRGRWPKHRHMIFKQAKLLHKKYKRKVAIGKIKPKAYFAELSRCKIGYNWRGTALINWRVSEYVRNGVVMITDPYGERFPFRDDVIFEDDVNCVVCDQPSEFARVTLELLSDKIRLRRLRENVQQLWCDKLCPIEHGKWILKHLLAAK
jgi:hypothetical protein